MSRKLLIFLFLIFALQIASVTMLFIWPKFFLLLICFGLFAIELAFLIEIVRKGKKDNFNFLKESLSSFKNISSQIAHDFANPMHVIQFCGNTLSKHVDEKGKKYLDRIMSCTDRSVAMIDDLKEIARVKQEEHKTFYDVHRFVIALVRLQYWKNMKPSSIFLDERVRLLPIHIPVKDLTTILYTIYKTFIGNNWEPVVEIGVEEVNPSQFTLKISSSSEFIFGKEDKLLLNKLLVRNGATLNRENANSVSMSFLGEFESIFSLYNINNSSSSHEETRLQ